MYFLVNYKDVDGDSGVEAYEIGSDSITVRFKGGALYCYTYMSAGKDNVDKMKELAKSGEDLNSFINTKVRTKYEWKR